jgi:tetratricopeptide (TPR) repeat protein
VTSDLLARLNARLAALAARADSGPILDDQAADEARRLLALLPADEGGNGPACLEAIRVIATVHWTRYCLREADAGEDLATAVELFSRLYRHDPTAVPEPLLSMIDTGETQDDLPPLTWDRLAAPYLSQYRSTGDLPALRTAVKLLAAARDASEPGSRQRLSAFSQLVAALSALHGDTGEAAVLEVLITVARAEALESAEGAHRGMALSALSNAFLIHAVGTADQEGLNQAVAAARAAVESAPAGDPLRPLFLGNLGTALLARFRQDGSPDGLHHAVSALREAVASTGPGEEDLPVRLANLSAALLDAFEQTGGQPELDDAVAAARAAVESALAGHPRSGVLYGNLATTLLKMYERTGNRAALDEAVALLRGALSDPRLAGADRQGALTIVSTALKMHYTETGDTSALVEAMEAARAAAGLVPDGHPDRPVLLGNLAAMLRALFDRTGNAAVLDQAVGLLGEAVSMTPPGHPRRPGHLSNLGNALRTRSGHTGDLQDLQEAVDAGRAAVRLVPAGHQDRPRFLTNLGGTLWRLFDRSGNAADLDEAVVVLREAVSATPPDHPDLTERLANFASVVLARFDAAGDYRDRQEAAGALRVAYTSATGPAQAQIQAAWAFADTAVRSGNFQEAVTAFQVAVDLLPQVAPLSLGRGDRERRLGRLLGLGSEAAAAALSAGHAGLAAELLEHARGILLGEALAVRHGIDDLAGRERGLADAFQRLLHAQQVLSYDDDPAAADRRRQLATEWDGLVGQIRALPGFEGFLRRPRVADLRREAEAGPIIMVNIASHRSDALILTSDPRAPVRVVPLPGVTPATLTGQVNDFLGALSAMDVAGSPAEANAAQRAVEETLAWTWDAIAGPVLDALGITGPPGDGQPWPAVWWCPTGLTAYLPLHAAGQPGAGSRTGVPSALDRVVSSYTPTVQALAFARRRVAKPWTESGAGGLSGALVVGVPDPPGAFPLPHVLAETEFLTRMLPDATVLLAAQASRETVLAELPRHPVLHLACHAETNWKDASASRLLLHDGDLSVRDLLSVRSLDRTELVVLSACSTASATADSADEAIHLSSAFLAAGAGHVVGTLWPVDDQIAAEAAKSLYTALAPSTERTAFALHEATRSLRDRHPRWPSLWAAFVHNGR